MAAKVIWPDGHVTCIVTWQYWGDYSKVCRIGEHNSGYLTLHDCGNFNIGCNFKTTVVLISLMRKLLDHLREVGVSCIVWTLPTCLTSKLVRATPGTNVMPCVLKEFCNVCDFQTQSSLPINSLYSYFLISWYIAIQPDNEACYYLRFSKTYVLSTFGNAAVTFVSGALALYAPKFMTKAYRVSGDYEIKDSTWVSKVIF